MDNKGFFSGLLVAACLAMAVGMGLMLAEFRADRLDRDRVNNLTKPCPCPDCKCRLPTAPGPAVPNRKLGDVGDTK